MSTTVAVFSSSRLNANCDAGYQAENYAEDLAGFTALLKTRRAYVS